MFSRTRRDAGMALFLPTLQPMNNRLCGLFTRHHHNCNRYKSTTQSQVKATVINPRPRSDNRCRDAVKKKVALVVGYDGAGYHGLQRNRDVTTISDVLENALHAAGAISDDNVGDLQKIKWQTAARTDRGVCAAGNVISLKLLFSKEEQMRGTALQQMELKVNDFLPDQVRVFGIRKITGSFSARANCGARWYEYLLPTTALPSGASLEDFGRVLSVFEGTHAFHNYTIGQDHVVPPRHQALRYISEMICDPEPICLPGQGLSDARWVRIRVKGQSFMLHQIRKMVSMAVLTMHEKVPQDAIGISFSRKVLIDVPPAPAVGLFLDCCRFDGYNERHKDSLAEPLSTDVFESQREDFKFRHIFPSIARRSLEEDELDVFFRTVEAHPPKF